MFFEIISGNIAHLINLVIANLRSGKCRKEYLIDGQLKKELKQKCEKHLTSGSYFAQNQRVNKEIEVCQNDFENELIYVL